MYNHKLYLSHDGIVYQQSQNLLCRYLCLILDELFSRSSQLQEKFELTDDFISGSGRLSRSSWEAYLAIRLAISLAKLLHSSIIVDAPFCMKDNSLSVLTKKLKYNKF